MTHGRAIGRHGDLIYHISADLRRFKNLTMGHPLIMGRKTFESLPGGALPGRRNMIVSHHGAAYQFNGAETFESIDNAIAALAPDDEAFVIGGGQIYTKFIDKADKLYITEIDAEAPADADTFFPEFDSRKWCISEQSAWETDARNNVRYRFTCLSRI